VLDSTRLLARAALRHAVGAKGAGSEHDAPSPEAVARFES